MITIEGISKYFGKKKEVRALHDIHLHVKEGEIFGLIGPDGSGKTTLFRILTTLVLPDEGSATVNGLHIVKDYKAIRQIVGYMPGRFSLYQDLSVEENLTFYATIFDTTIEKNYYLIEDIYKQIEPFKTRRAGALSGGMKQKLALCCALIHKPTVLFLDEPTTGVDVVSRKEFWAMLKRLKDQGITIFVSTPYMDEATLCDRIALIQEGHLLDINTPATMSANYPHTLYGIKTPKMNQALKALDQLKNINGVYPFGEYMHLATDDKSLDIPTLSRYLSQQGHENIEIKPIAATIEDVFINLLQKHQNA